jgi:hypothetical protein
MSRSTLAMVFVACAFATPTYATALKTFSDTQLGFEVAMPATCRHATGPGVIEAVCAPDLDPKASRGLAAARGWLFEVDYEVAPADAAPYTLDALKAEAPSMICGEPDASTVTISKPREMIDSGRQIFSADVACPAKDFLKLPERAATVRVIISGARRFRLIARTPAEDARAAAGLTEAFLASFKLTAQ